MQPPQLKLISGSDDLSLFEEYFDHFFTRDSVVAVVLEQGQDLLRLACMTSPLEAWHTGHPY